MALLRMGWEEYAPYGMQRHNGSDYRRVMDGLRGAHQEDGDVLVPVGVVEKALYLLKWVWFAYVLMDVQKKHRGEYDLVVGWLGKA